MTYPVFSIRFARKVCFYAINKAERYLYRLGNKKKCYVCKRKVGGFTRYLGQRRLSDICKVIDVVGSDTKNFGCIHCRSHDRERHIFMYFDKLGIWDQMRNQKILHFAPERNLHSKIKEQGPLRYVMADFSPELYPKVENIEKIDVTKIPYGDMEFDIVLCNHVLEHIPDYLQALKEIYRILKPGGMAILQTPYAKNIDYNFEFGEINTPPLRSYYYGQYDHLRTFSEKHFFRDLEKTGFILQIAKNDDFFNEQESWYYGVNKKEDLIRVVKPKIPICGLKHG